MSIFAQLKSKIHTDPLSSYPKLHPVTLGLPDFLSDEFRKRDNELWSTCWLRRAAAIKEFVEGKLRAIKGGTDVPIILFPEQLEFIVDTFYGRAITGKKIRKAILWKSRGGGGSLCVAVVIWMKMVWFGWPFIDMAGSGEQAKQVYDYTTHFWHCIPSTQQLLDGEPRMTFTHLKSGASLKCIPASEKQSRSKHVPGFVADEACQKDPNVGDYIRTAMSGVFSEPEYIAILLSTFHVATGFFQERWDAAETQGYKTYYWNIFHTMKACTQGLKDFSTPGDPKALEYCREKCPLTKREQIHNEDGEFIRWDYQWCAGLARDSSGFQSYRNTLAAKLEHDGTDTFHVEFAGNRPITSGPVYNPIQVEAAFRTKPLEILKGSQSIVGIDWGFSGETSIVGPVFFDGKYILIPQTTYLSGVGLEDTLSILEQLRGKYGDFGIFCDSSHPYNIDHLHRHGWDVEAVFFQKWKEYGIGNVARWLAQNKVQISEGDSGNLKLKKQMLRYYRGENGKPIKKHDHGPDALLCALLNWNFLDYELLEGVDAEEIDGVGFIW